MPLAGPFGSYFSSLFSSKYGIKKTLKTTLLLFFISGILQTISQTMLQLTIARCLAGLASGSSTVIVPLYLGEISPPNIRGTLGTVTQFAMVIGILASNLFALLLGNGESWRSLFSVTAVISVLCWGGTERGIVESPRWLLVRDEGCWEARGIIRRLRGLRYDEEIEVEVEHILASSSSSDPPPSTLTLFLDPTLRPIMLTCCLLQMAQQFCGINAVFYYSTMFFDGVIDNPLLGSVVVAGINVGATYVALLLMDRCGRRQLILWSCMGMFWSVVVIVFGMKGVFGSSYVALVAVMSFVSFFEIGLGPIPWLIVAEMVHPKYVTPAMSVCSQLNWICNFCVGFIFPIMNEKLGYLSFMPFGVVLLLTYVYSYLNLQVVMPEIGPLKEELEKRRKSIDPAIFESISENLGGDLNNHQRQASEWARATSQIQHQEEVERSKADFNYGFHSVVAKDDSGTKGTKWLGGMGLTNK